MKIKTVFYDLKFKKPLIYFFIKLALLFFIIFTIDYCLGYTLNYFYFKQKAGLQFRTTYSIDKTKAEIIIIGSSRSNHHYHPAIFENKIQYSFYNTGRDGSSIFYHFLILKSILNRYIPKLIILDLNRGVLAKNQSDYDRLSSLLPYYKTHPEMHSILETRSPHEKFKLFSSTYPYNSMILTIIFGNLEFTQNQLQDDKGYVALNKIIKNQIPKKNSKSKYNIDSLKNVVLESFIKMCKKSNVELFLVNSPSFSIISYEDHSIKLGKELCKKYNINFIDFSRNQYFIEKPNLFQDVGHLNDDGAKVFSEMLIDSIKYYKPNLKYR